MQCVMGADKVGKSTLTQQFVRGDNNSPSPTEDSGFGRFRKEMEIGGRRHWLEVLDTAGISDPQTIDHILPSEAMIKSSRTFAVMYSVDSKKSFETAKGIFDRVLDQRKPDNLPLIFVGNKRDLEHREVSTDEGMQFASQHAAPFCELSSKDATEVDRVFHGIIQEYSRCHQHTQASECPSHME